MNRAVLSRGFFLVILAGIFLSNGMFLDAQEVSQDRKVLLEKAISKMWLEGFDAEVKKSLETIAAQNNDAIAEKALFHLGCAEAMEGNKKGTLQRLEQIEKLSKNDEAKGRVESLRRLLNPSPPATGPISLDFKEVPIPMVLQRIAQITGRGIIVDAGVDDKRITIHIPKVDFNQVMDVLGKIGNFEMKFSGDLILISPRNNLANDENSSQSGSDNITFNFKDVDIRDLLQLIANRGKMNLVIHKSVRGFITIQLDKISPVDALRLVARANDLHIEKDGDNLLVMNGKEVVPLSGKQSFAIVPLRFLNPQDALSILNNEKILGAEIAQDGHNNIRIVGPPETIEKAKSLLETQDKPQKPVMISVKIWEITKPKGFNIDDFIKQPLEDRGQFAKLISAPRILTLSNREATIEIGEKNGKELESGISLEMRPLILPNNLVQIDMRGNIISKVVEDQKNFSQQRKFASTFVIKPQNPFAYEVQGGNTAMVLEFLVTRPE